MFDLFLTVLGATSDLIPDFMRSMHPRQRLTLLLPIAYMLGSIPFGLVIGRMKGVDVTRSGSGNIGATNVGRLLGRKYFYIVFTLDMFKGLLPMLLAGLLLADAREQQAGELTVRQYFAWLAVGFATIIGHMFSAFLKFRGGKGIATSAGVLMGLYPFFTLPGVGVLMAWFVVFKATRYVSLASIVAALTFPLFYVGFAIWRGWPLVGAQLPLLVFAVVVATLLVYKHRSNIRRLMKGEEPHYHPRSSSEHRSHRHHRHHGEADASAG